MYLFRRTIQPFDKRKWKYNFKRTELDFKWPHMYVFFIECNCVLFLYTHRNMQFNWDFIFPLCPKTVTHLSWYLSCLKKVIQNLKLANLHTNNFYTSLNMPYKYREDHFSNFCVKYFVSHLIWLSLKLKKLHHKFFKNTLKW